MQTWFIYALIAALFIGVKDLITKDITKRYSYIEYILVANLFVFILTLIYILRTFSYFLRPLLFFSDFQHFS